MPYPLEENSFSDPENLKLTQLEQLLIEDPSSVSKGVRKLMLEELKQRTYSSGFADGVYHESLSSCCL